MTNSERTTMHHARGMSRARIGTFLLALALVALGPLAVYGPNGTVIVLGVALLGLIVSASDMETTGRAFSRFCRGHGLLIAGIGLGCLWILAASFWAPVATSEKAIRSVLVILCGLASVTLLALVVPQRMLSLAALLSGGLMLGLFFFEAATDGSLIWLLNPPEVSSPSLTAGRPGQNPVQQGTAILAVLLWPWMVMVIRRWRQPWLAVPLVLLAGFVVYRLPMAASAVAVLAGLCVFAATWLGGRRIVYILFAALLIYIAAAPLLSRPLLFSGSLTDVAAELPESWQHRLGIWNRTAELIDERPLTGYGFHASRWVGKLDDSQVLIHRGASPSLEAAAMPLHPHNAALQLWLELGGVGIVLLLTTLAGLCRAIVALPDRQTQAAAAAATMAFGIIALVSFGFWQTWWQALIWLAAMLIYISAANRETEQPANGN